MKHSAGYLATLRTHMEGLVTLRNTFTIGTTEWSDLNAIICHWNGEYPDFAV